MILLRQQNGVILLTTVIMIAIITLLILSLMQSVSLYIKASNQIVRKHQDMYQMEKIAHTLSLENNVIKEGCMIKDKDVNQLMDPLLRDQGCLVVNDKQQYYYLVDDLGLYPCLFIVSETKIYSSYHWLIQITTAQPPYAILQLRIAKPIPGGVCDLAYKSQINPGIISWRYFTSKG